MASFTDKYGPWALVTGASSGIGAEFVRQLAPRGMNIVLAARRTEKMESLAADVAEQHGIETRVVSVDLAKADFLSSLRGATGDIEIGLLVNNAGFGTAGAFLENDLGRELAMLDVNCRAAVILAHEYGKAMVERGRGGIVFVASIMAFLSAPHTAGYAASKGHNLQYGEALYYELKPKNVDVIALCPGATRTEFQEVSGMTGDYPLMPVEPVVASALRNLGRKPSVVAGWQNKSLYALMKLFPRRIIAWGWNGSVRKMIGK